MDDATRAYAKRVAEAVRDECTNAGNDEWNVRVRGIDLDAIIASVPPPEPTVEQQVREAVEREREECLREACEVIQSVTGPTGGWIASPREVQHSLAWNIEARSTQAPPATEGE